jgi:hypothetical protein
LEEKINNNNIMIENIKILKHNSDYRVADIVYKRGERWEHSAEMVLTKSKYNGTILQKYLKINGIYNPTNLPLLLQIIKEYHYPVPNNNELVIHLRLGDVVVHDWFLSKDYISFIRNMLQQHNNINKLTFVTCFAYQEWSQESLHLRKNAQLWKYTDEDQEKNVVKVTKLFNNIKNTFPNLELNIYSNYNIDMDMRYCVFSKYFISDEGGFSKLLLTLQKMNNNYYYIYLFIIIIFIGFIIFYNFKKIRKIINC